MVFKPTAAGSASGSVKIATNAAGSPAVVSLSGVGLTWVKCAVEGGFCSFSGTKTVRYGIGTSWYTKTLTNGTGCNNTVFGDPAHGYVKECDIAQ
jgi:serine protease